MPLFTRSFWLLLFIGWGSALGARAQTGTMRGRLLETGTGQLVSFANVVLLSGPDSAFGGGAQADTVGAFTVANVAPGRYVLRATAVDCSTDSRYKRESRIAYLGFAYRFGGNQSGRPKDRKEADDAGTGGFD